MKLIREDNGKWRFSKKIKNAHFSYQPASEKYLTKLDPFFSKAKEKSEFEFILSLLRVRGLSDGGWDTLEALRETHRSFNKITKIFKDDNHTTTQFSLFMYGLIIEASEPYEILANLINIIEGKRFSTITHFPDHTDPSGKTRSMSPADKISKLKSRAKKVKLDLNFLDEFFDNKLRNSIFHSDYTVYNNEVRLLHPTTVYKKDDWHNLINKALAYFESLMTIYDFNISEYKEPKIIVPHPEFTPDKEERCITIIRKGYGLIGMKDNWRPEQIAQGKIPHEIGRFKNYERRLIRKGKLIMPKDRIKRVNKLLNLLPKFISRQIVKKISKYFR